MFEKVNEIINQIEYNKSVISKNKELMKQAKTTEQYIEIASQFDNINSVLSIENKILYDNARIEMFKEVMPNALKIWNEYENKPYGSKTKERIKEKIRKETGCWFYAEANTFGGDEFNFYPDFKEYPKLYYFFGTKDFNITSHPYGKKFLIYNKIQHVDFEEVKLYYCNEYVERTYDEATNIYEQVQKVKADFESLSNRVSELNKRLPSKCEYINLGYPTWWNIV